MKKHPLISILVAVVVLLLLAVLLVPLFVNANTFRSTLETQLSSALGRKVTLGNLSFSVFSGSLVADNISIADDPAFSAKPFLQAQSLHIGVEVVPLLFHRQLLVTSFVADSPSINLVHNAQGVWNFSNIGSTAGSRTQNIQKETALPNFTVGEMQGGERHRRGLGRAVYRASVYLQQPESVRAAVLLCQGFSLRALRQSSRRRFARREGQRRAGKPEGRFRDATERKHKLEALRSRRRRRGSGEPGYLHAGRHHRPGHFQRSDPDQQRHRAAQPSCNWWPTALRRRPRSISPTPSTTTWIARSGQINDLAINTGGVAVHVNGTYAMKGAQTMLALHLAAPNLPINQVEALLPAAGVRLPSGSRLQGGTLTANLAITGPATAPTISGPVRGGQHPAGRL